MADAGKTSVAGSLSATFNEKLKVAGAKAGGGDHKELNVAVIKATTSQFHVVPKEKHVRTLKLGVQPSQGRRNVQHIITELHRRLQESTDWLTALKTLITMHRLMRETEPAFMDELMRYSTSLAQGAGGAGATAPSPRLFCSDNFIDRSTTGEGRFDFSEWVRAYGKYLEEQLAVYSALKWYVEMEAPGAPSRMRSLPARDLLQQLPHLQRLERRLLDCVPRGAAKHDPVVLFSLSLVVKESFKVYKAVSEGVINLADAFFEMDYNDATQGLEFYKESIGASDALSGYYGIIGQIDEIKRAMQLPQLTTMPADFLSSMEAYLAEAPRQLGAAGDAPAPKRGAPLRKGKLLQGTGSGGALRVASGVSAGAAAAAAADASGLRDPGMVLPLPSSASPAASQSAESGGRAHSAATSPTATSRAAEAAGGVPHDLLGDTGAPEPADEAAASRKPAPSPLDLLSGLDFNFPASGGDGMGGAEAGPPFSSNPFADLPVAVAPAAPPSQQAQHQQPASFGSNPFGEPMPSPAAAAPGGGFGGSAGFEWPLASAAPPAQPQQPQQFGWGAGGGAAQQHQQGYGGVGGGYGAALPSPVGHQRQLAVSSDDPFASFGAPSPAGSAPRPAGGAFWASPPPPPPGTYGAGPSPPGHIAYGDEMSKAALHDPFAALTGLPPKSSPGAAGNKPSPPRTGLYPSPPQGGFH